MKNTGKTDKNKRNNGSGSQRRLAPVVLALLLILSFFVIRDNEKITEMRQGLSGNTETTREAGEVPDSELPEGNAMDAEELPAWNGDNFIEVQGGVPSFPQKMYEKAGISSDSDSGKNTPDAFEYYGPLDDLGRCTLAYGCLGEETMPEQGEDRGDIASIHPSGWAKGQGWERSHLIAWALGAENANERNLVTGTHYFNNDGMRPLEEEVEHYIWDTGNHVLYLVRPVFAGDELVPRGVLMSAMSVEDNGRGISFNNYCFNVTPDAEIDYHTGIVTTEVQANQDARDYVINVRSGVFHYPTCDSVKEMSGNNRRDVHATRSELTSQGYTPCGYCEP